MSWVGTRRCALVGKSRKKNQLWAVSICRKVQVGKLLHYCLCWTKRLCWWQTHTEIERAGWDISKTWACFSLALICLHRPQTITDTCRSNGPAQLSSSLSVSVSISNPTPNPNRWQSPLLAVLFLFLASSSSGQVFGQRKPRIKHRHRQTGPVQLATRA